MNTPSAEGGGLGGFVVLVAIVDSVYHRAPVPAGIELIFFPVAAVFWI